MRWARQQEFDGTAPDVLLEAAGLSFALFEARLLAGGSLATCPQLLHTDRTAERLELTIASGPSAVWRETFGTWESSASRVPFLTQAEGADGPVDVLLHYWDKSERVAESIAFWTGDDQVLDEFSAAVTGRHWGVPWSVVKVEGLAEGSTHAVDDLSAIAGSLGLFPTVGRRDAALDSACVQVAGDVSSAVRSVLVETISRSMACDPDAVSIRPGQLE